MALISICQAFAWAFPKAWNLIVDADSLAIIDFARDIVLGKSISAWNLPRAPYLFPDALIAIIVMSIGWINGLTFLLIATINFFILIAASYWVVNQSKSFCTTSVWLIVFLITFSLFLIGCVFPFAMDNLYWQIFASGAHFLTAIVVLLIMELTRPQGAVLPSKLNLIRLGAIIFLIFAEALSDSISALLLLIWYIASIVPSDEKSFKRWTQYLYVPAAVFFGTALSFFIPRQALIGSFFSFQKFITGVELFLHWMSSSLTNGFFIGALVATSICFPFLIRDQIPRTTKEFCAGLFCSYSFPALGVIAATPLFYQDTGSLRYLAFPALLMLLSISLVLLKIINKALSLRLGRQLVTVIGIFLISGMFFLITYTKRIDEQTNKEITLLNVLGTIPFSQDADLAVKCIEKASALHPLSDGIATYWHARPIYFASKFKNYLAPISPWQPRGGYMYWGNNGLDLVYKEGNPNHPRRYNYVLSTNDEMSLNLWGSLVSQSVAQTQCAQHTVLFFSDTSILENFLFPFGKPFAVDSKNRVVVPNNNAYEWAARPYWGSDLFTLVGMRDGMSILASGHEGVLVYGPFITLPSGSYRLAARGHLTGSTHSIGYMEVSSKQGQLILASTPIISGGEDSNEIGELIFKLEKSVSDVEFRILVNQHVRGIFSQYELVKLPD